MQKEDAKRKFNLAIERLVEVVPPSWQIWLQKSINNPERMNLISSDKPDEDELSQSAGLAYRNLCLAKDYFLKQSYQAALGYADMSLRYSACARPHKDFMDARA